jgi:hypothetical protein
MYMFEIYDCRAYLQPACQCCQAVLLLQPLCAGLLNACVDFVD